jgi:tetratricopeptide (TPR) repeat protein
VIRLAVVLVVASCTQIDIERAVSLDGSGDFVAGNKILDEVLKREGNAVTHQRANALLELALNRQKVGKVLDAEVLLQEAILVQEEVGDDPYMKAWGVRYLANLMVLLERYDEAEALYRRAITLNKQGMGYWRRLVSGERPANYDLHWSELGLADVLMRLQRYEEATAILKHEIDEYKGQPSFIPNGGASVFGIINLGIFRNDELYVSALITLGDLYSSQGKRDDSLTVFRKAAETAKERLPDTSPFARTALERFFDFSSETPDRDKIPDDLVRSAEASSGSGSPYGMGDAYRRAEALLKEKKSTRRLLQYARRLQLSNQATQCLIL